MLSGLSQATKAASISLCFSCEQIAHWPLCRLREAVADLGPSFEFDFVWLPISAHAAPDVTSGRILRAKASVGKPQTARCAEPLLIAISMVI
jgi:hypothetical protein